jgi:hypothetical protein
MLLRPGEGMRMSRSKNVIRAILFPLVLPGATLSAFSQNAPWQKPCAEWTRQDAVRVLEDSPWTRRIGVPAVWLRPGAEGLEVGTAVRLGKVPSRQESPEVRGEAPLATFLLRWESSRAVACARQLLPERAKEFIGGSMAQAPAPDEIVLHLVRDNWVRFFRVLDVASLVENTYLTLRSSGQRAFPSRIEIFRDAEGDPQGLTFFFRRFGRDGRPWLSANEDRVEFHCRIGGVATFHTHFLLREMVFETMADY